MLHRAAFTGRTWPAVFGVKYVIAAPVVLIYAVVVDTSFAGMFRSTAGTIFVICQGG
jgi:hypothetical protein